MILLFLKRIKAIKTINQTELTMLGYNTNLRNIPYLNPSLNEQN